MRKKRTMCSPEFKAKAALAALQNDETVPDLSAWFNIHSAMINNWKRTLLGGAADVFDKGQKSNKPNEAQVEDLYPHIGQLTVERDFLSKKLRP